jgi:large subunit ribosomal protein L17
MLANMACSLIEHKRIKTTLAKAKALRVYVEPLITKSKSDTTHSRRTVFSYLKQKEAITELFSDIATKVASRPGGYTRILKLSNRLGDNAQMAYIELVDYNEVYTTERPKRKKARRVRKKGVDVAPLVEEAVVVEDSSINQEESTSKTQLNQVVEEVKEEITSLDEVDEKEISNESVSKNNKLIDDEKSNKDIVEEIIQEDQKKDKLDSSPNKEDKGE